jgi:hypothetical protein
MTAVLPRRRMRQKGNEVRETMNQEPQRILATFVGIPNPSPDTGIALKGVKGRCAMSGEKD